MTEISPEHLAILKQVPEHVLIEAARLRDDCRWDLSVIGWRLCGKEVAHDFMPVFVEYGRMLRKAVQKRERNRDRLTNLDLEARAQWALEQWERCEAYAPIGRKLGISAPKAEALIGTAMQLNAGMPLPRQGRRNGLVVKRSYRYNHWRDSIHNL